MNLAMMIYFIDVICGGHGGLAVVTGIMLLLWVFGFMISICIRLDEGFKKEDREQFMSIYKSLWPLKTFVVVMCVLSTVVPDKDTAYKMLAAYGIESIVTNPEVQKLGGKSLDVLNKAMDEYLQEEKPATTISPEKVEK